MSEGNTTFRTTRTPEVVSRILEDDGRYPNNSSLPLLIYRQAIDLHSVNDASAVVEEVFHGNNWRGSWRNGIFSYHHYHSTAHEVLGIYSGRVRVQLGGPEGIVSDAAAGDVVVIPAGVAHKNLDSDRKFRCIGAYPDGQRYDMNYGKPGERPEADENISRVDLPSNDPVFGSAGPLIDHWR